MIRSYHLTLLRRFGTNSKFSMKDLIKSKVYLRSALIMTQHVSCQKGKQAKSSFHSKNVALTTKPLELLHLDLFGTIRTTSLRSKKYGLVIMDNFSRFTWAIFLVHKDEACEAFKIFLKRIQNEKSFCITSIKSNHGGEFENHSFENFCNENGIFHKLLFSQNSSTKWGY